MAQYELRTQRRNLLLLRQCTRFRPRGKGKIGVPKERHTVAGQNLKLGWRKAKVYRLHGNPQDPIRNQNTGHLFLQTGRNGR